jgi:hypothetical protein
VSIVALYGCLFGLGSLLLSDFRTGVPLALTGAVALVMMVRGMRGLEDAT